MGTKFHTSEPNGQKKKLFKYFLCISMVHLNKLGQGLIGNASYLSSSIYAMLRTKDHLGRAFWTL